MISGFGDGDGVGVDWRARINSLTLTGSDGVD